MTIHSITLHQRAITELGAWAQDKCNFFGSDLYPNALGSAGELAVAVVLGSLGIPYDVPCFDLSRQRDTDICARGCGIEVKTTRADSRYLLQRIVTRSQLLAIDERSSCIVWCAASVERVPWRVWVYGVTRRNEFRRLWNTGVQDVSGEVWCETSDAMVHDVQPVFDALKARGPLEAPRDYVIGPHMRRMRMLPKKSA